MVYLANMKKIFLLSVLLVGLHSAGLSQGAPPITLVETDGSPRKTAPTRIVVPNGTLTCSGSVCTLTFNPSTGIVDANGNAMFTFTATASAVNSFSFTNAATGNPPTMAVIGSDTNINLRLSPKGTGILESTGPLRLSGTGSDQWTTPQNIQIPTKISVPLYDPGSFGQILAMGLASGTSASARVITLADNRSAGHQPTLMLLTPDEQDNFGLSWDGSNTTAKITTSKTGGIIAIQASGGFQPPSATLTNLGTPADGIVFFCSDCNVNTDPCTSGGTGALAIRANSRWYCP